MNILSSLRKYNQRGALSLDNIIYHQISKAEMPICHRYHTGQLEIAAIPFDID